MNRLTLTMLRRSIRGSLGRFLAILAIVALGVGFFAGIKSSQPDLLHSLDRYYRGQHMYDFQLLSSLGFTEEDAEAFRALPGVAEAEGACFADAWAAPDGGEEAVWYFQSLTESVAVPVLTAGRMPENDGECLGDDKNFSEADLGKTITLSAENSEDTLDLLPGRRFTLVGLARSPRYISRERGSTDLGSGKREGFVFLRPGAFHADGVYHELLLWCDLPGEIYSETYSDARRSLRPAVETLLNRRGLVRQAALRAENSGELADARKELDDGWAEYRAGKRKSERELASALRTLTASREQLDAGWRLLEESEKALEKEEQKIADDRLALTEKQAELTARMTELQTEHAGLLTELSTFELNRAAALSLYTTELASATSALIELQAMQLDPDSGMDPAVLDVLIEAAQIRVDNAREALKTAADDYDSAHAEELDALSAELKEVTDELAALTDEYAETQTEEMTLSAEEEILPETRKQLEASRKQLQQGEDELAAGRTEYEDGKAKAEKELAEALEKLEDGEKEYAKGLAELEEALLLNVYTLDRNANTGYVGFENDTVIIDSLADVFPVFFVLVAMLVCVTTMTRMVNEERTQIGTMKAMGYSSGAIMAKYLMYTGLSALLGCLAGFFLGSTGLPYFVWFAYNIMYHYTGLLFRYSGGMLAGCLAVSVAGSLLATWLAGRSALEEKPAELIRPKAPAAGKRVLLERIPALWVRLPFLTKVSLRNAFRYPSRVLMMILGISGCTALMVAGFGIRDSIAQVAEYQYEEIALYDMTAMLDADKAGPEVSKLWDGWAGASARVRKEEVVLTAGDREKRTDLISGSAEEAETVLSLHGEGGVPVAWPEPGCCVITEKLADTLSLRTGDTLTLRRESGAELRLRVTGVCRYYVGHAVFADAGSVARWTPNCALIRAAEGEDAELRAAELRTGEGVSYVSLTQTERDMMESSMASLDLIVIVLVFCSGALAFITLYNLTNINIMERIREVATVKVLGFMPGETARYVLSENLLLSFLGALCGLVLGKLLHLFIMSRVNVDYLSFDVRVAPLSFAVAFAATLVFAVLTNLLMRRKLEQVNMAESLKSVE
ncbi:MAG: FtsX-like permease family protein [Oscillospiraceae bacterium]|nr:FtsX-like permease family protein [Oscillospiraceae bacterium]